MFLSQYTLMSVCMRSAETAFQIGETGSSLGPAPAPQNRLPPLGSDCCTNSMCLCHSSLGPLPLCMLPWSACSQEKCVSDYVVLQRERKAAGVPTSGTAGVSSCRMNTVVFTRSPICSMRAWGGFEFNLCYPEDLYSHLNCFLTSINPAGTAVNFCLKILYLCVCVCVLLAKYLWRVFYSVICGALMCGEGAEPSVGQADAEGQSEGCVTWQKSLGAGWSTRQILGLQWAYWHDWDLRIAETRLSTEGSPNSLWCWVPRPLLERARALKSLTLLDLAWQVTFFSHITTPIWNRASLLVNLLPVLQGWGLHCKPQFS